MTEHSPGYYRMMVESHKEHQETMKRIALEQLEQASKNNDDKALMRIGKFLGWDKGLTDFVDKDEVDNYLEGE